MKEHLQIHTPEYILLGLLAVAVISLMYISFSFDQRQTENCKEAIKFKPVAERCVGV